MVFHLGFFCFNLGAVKGERFRGLPGSLRLLFLVTVFWHVYVLQNN